MLTLLSNNHRVNENLKWGKQPHISCVLTFNQTKVIIANTVMLYSCFSPNAVNNNYHKNAAGSIHSILIKSSINIFRSSLTALTTFYSDWVSTTPGPRSLSGCSAAAWTRWTKYCLSLFSKQFKLCKKKNRISKIRYYSKFNCLKLCTNTFIYHAIIFLLPFKLCTYSGHYCNYLVTKYRLWIIE